MPVVLKCKVFLYIEGGSYLSLKKKGIYLSHPYNPPLTYKPLCWGFVPNVCLSPSTFASWIEYLSLVSPILCLSLPVYLEEVSSLFGPRRVEVPSLSLTSLFNTSQLIPGRWLIKHIHPLVPILNL